MAPDPAARRALAPTEALPFGCHPRLTASEFAAVAALQGTYYRRVAGRETLRLTLDGHGTQGWFLKRHRGVGWREIAKNLVQGRLPVLGAVTEYRAIERLHAIGVPTLVVAGFGQGGRSPAQRFSYLLTRELPASCSLETLCADWGERAAWPPARRLLQRRLLERLAWTLARMHAHGVNHRDCYLCHFHVPAHLASDTPLQPDTPVTVIDLHRAQIRHRVPRRWRIKDIGGLYYSALDSGLTESDCLRFVAHYQRHYLALTSGPDEAPPRLREILRRDGRFWRRVAANAAFMYEKRFGRRTRLPLGE